MGCVLAQLKVSGRERRFKMFAGIRKKMLALEAFFFKSLMVCG